jgi:hypothetical protein
MRRLATAFILSWATWLAVPAGAEPIAVRWAEGPTYGLVALSSLGGEVLADGELIQTVKRHSVESQLTFRFKDGSLHDEVVVFTQDKVFRLVSYRLTQRGPTFPDDMEVAFDRGSGHYQVRYREHAKDKDERHEGRVEMPADLYNGMGSLLIRHLSGRRGSGHLLAFSPKPRLLRLELIPAGENAFLVGSVARSATRYLMKLEVPGLMGALATVAGKDPPDVHYWISNAAPGFLKFEGSMFLNGPIWRIEPSPARWSQ